MGTLAVQDGTGHEEIHWDPSRPFEVEKARRKFQDEIGRGAKAFRQNHLGGQGEPITEFDPKAAHITLVRPLSGG